MKTMNTNPGWVNSLFKWGGYGPLGFPMDYKFSIEGIRPDFNILIEYKNEILRGDLRFLRNAFFDDDSIQLMGRDAFESELSRHFWPQVDRLEAWLREQTFKLTNPEMGDHLRAMMNDRQWENFYRQMRMVLSTMDSTRDYIRINFYPGSFCRKSLLFFSSVGLAVLSHVIAYKLVWGMWESFPRSDINLDDPSFRVLPVVGIHSHSVAWIIAYCLSIGGTIYPLLRFPFLSAMMSCGDFREFYADLKTYLLWLVITPFYMAAATFIIGMFTSIWLAIIGGALVMITGMFQSAKNALRS